jgi:uncharacterized delta-60 repeat protein
MNTAQHSGARVGYERRRKRWTATARATASVIERLELRQLFTSVPTATIAGPSTVAEGSNYALALSTANRTTPVDHWTVTWGDGQQTTAAGSATEADHVYADGPNAYTISATATLTNGVTLTANLVGAGVTNPGALDPAFGSAGEVVSGSTFSTAEGVAAFDNGQFVVAGSVGSGTSATQVLERFNADGSVDTTFGTNGILTVAGATGIVSVIDEHIADPNHPGYQVERLLVVGNENPLNGYNCHPYLWRYDIGEGAYGLTDGTPDSAFGTSGVVMLPTLLPSAPYEGDNSAAATIAPNGQIVVAGVAWHGSGVRQGGQWLTVSRLNTNGSLDTSFDTTGQQYAAVGGYNNPSVSAPMVVVGVVAAADGSVVAMTSGGGLAKMTNAGQLDTTFGTAGVAAEAPYASPRSVYYQALTLDAAGNLLLGGTLRFGSSYGWAVGRYSYSTGAIDTTYGAADPNDTSGFAGIEGRLTSTDSSDGITELTTLASGQVVSLSQQTPAGSGAAWQMNVGRFNTDGTPDTSFAATTGFTALNFGGTAATPAGLAVQPDGKLLVAETYQVTTPSNLTKFGVARLGQTVAGTSTAVSVSVSNVPPTPTISAPLSAGPEGTAISLSGSATDPSPVDTAAGLALAWSVTDNGAAYASGTGASLTFTPNDNGTYVVTLTATDKDGGVGTTTDTIAVANVPPTPTIAAPVTAGLEGTTISLSGSATDPSTVDTAAGLTLAWSVTKNGAPYASATGTSCTFTPNDNGTYAVTLSATDKDGGVGTTTDTIVVANVAPTATIAAPVTSGLEGTSVTLSGSATDPSTLDTSAGLTLGWSVTKNGAAYATGAGGSCTFTPNDNGTYVVTLSATDKDGGVGTATDTIAVANVAPTATMSAPTGTAYEGSPLAFAGSATDPSTIDTAAGLTLGWSVTKNGAAYATGSGAAYTFTPNDNGTYVVTLSATDKDGGVGAATDTVAVLNVAPAATITAPISAAPEGTAITLTGAATDPSTADTAAGLTKAWAVTKNGSPFASGSGGSITFTPDDNGAFVATFTATDKDGGVGTATDAITVNNVAPTPTIAAPVTTGYTGIAISLTGSATDLSPVDTAAGLPLAWSVTQNGNVVASGGTGASYSFTPATTGTYVVTLTATDKDGGVGTATDTVNVVTAGYRLSGSNLMYNGTVEQTGVASYALRADGNAYYLTTGKVFGVNQYAGGTNSSLGLVYSYGMRNDGYAYYWSQADSKLYLNIPSQNIPVDTNAICGFGMRSDGYGYFWETASHNLYINAPAFTVPIDNNPVSGFGVRSDGSAYFWDSVTKILEVNTPAANYQVGTGPVQGFGMRADGSGYFWDTTTGNLYVNIATGAPAGTSIQLNSSAVSAFTTDSDGNGYYVPVGTTTLRRNTTSTDTLITSTYVPGTLHNAGPGPVSAVSYSMVSGGVTTPVTIPL